eukprot:scaffold38580_cov75-Phaeocystis_antarctica.AAC.4
MMPDAVQCGGARNGVVVFVVADAVLADACASGAGRTYVHSTSDATEPPKSADPVITVRSASSRLVVVPITRMAPPSLSVALLSVNVELRTVTLPPVTSRAPPLSAWLFWKTEVCTAREPPLTLMAPPSRPSKTVSEIDTCPFETNSARTSVLALSRRPRRTLALPKRQPANSVLLSIRTCPSNSRPCSITGGAPARTSSRVEALLEIKARPKASLEMISSRLSVRFASITKPLTMCSPKDNLITTSSPWNTSDTFKRASSIVLYSPSGPISTDRSGGGGEGGGGEGGGGDGGGGEGG